jgi:peptide/nickel transport system ATP-binding protein
MSTRPFLRVEALTKLFVPRQTLLGRLAGRQGRGVLALDDVSFSIPKGRTYALVGESGSGKSTAALLVAGLIQRDRGKIEIDGIDLAEADPATRRALRRRVQMVFQDPFTSLNPRWRVGAIISEPLQALGLLSDRQAIAARVADLLSRVGLDSADAARFPHEFSGGQRQRIAIARMLAAEAELVICDEPTSALDVSVQAQILNLMRDLQEELGLTYLFISHNLAVVRFMADDIGVLKAGRLVEAGTAEAIFGDPQHSYTLALLAAVPEASVEAAVAARQARSGSGASSMHSRPGLIADQVANEF